jgi:hypothetical protein
MMQNDTIFHSGAMDADFNLIYENSDYEPHYNIIRSDTQVQIYEMVMGDVNSNPTTVLEQAYIQLKDNRIPPEGFTSVHNSYDTIKIVGNADTDNDFNKISGTEGTGKDIVHYHIPTLSYTGALHLTARVYYQTVTEKWLQDMFSYSSLEIDRFKQLFQNSKRNPFLVKENTLTSVYSSINEAVPENVQVFPNPTRDYVYIKAGKPLISTNIYDVKGARVMSQLNNPSVMFDGFSKIKVPSEKGVYILNIQCIDGFSYSTRVIVSVQ